MVVGVGAVRGLFVAGFVGWYSTGIFKAMDSHYGSQFGTYLRQQLRANEHMRRDVAAERRAMDRILEAKGMSLPGLAQDDVAWPPPQHDRDRAEARTPPAPAGPAPQEEQGVGSEAGSCSPPAAAADREHPEHLVSVLRGEYTSCAAAPGTETPALRSASGG